MKREPMNGDLPKNPVDRYGRSLDHHHQLDGQQLVIEITDINGFPYALHKIPLRQLPPNANAMCPLKLSARIENIPVDTLVSTADLTCWGGTGK